MKRILIFFLSPFLFFSVWEILAVTGAIDRSFFPPPTEIWTRLGQLCVHSAEFREHVFRSLGRVLVAALIAGPLAVLSAPWIVLSPTVGNWVRPLIALLYPIPKIAIFPLLLLIFGIGDASKVAVVAIGIFFLVLMSAMQGVQRLKEGGYFQIAQIYQIPLWRRIFDISIRGSLPEILNGLRMGFGNALVLIVASEFTIADRGIGVFIWNAWDQFNIRDVYAGIFMLSLVSLILFAGLDILQKRIKS